MYGQKTHETLVNFAGRPGCDSALARGGLAAFSRAEWQWEIGRDETAAHVERDRACEVDDAGARKSLVMPGGSRKSGLGHDRDERREAVGGRAGESRVRKNRARSAFVRDRSAA